MRRRPLQLASASVLIAAGVMLTACTPSVPEPEPTRTPSATPSATPTPSAEPSGEPAPTPLGIACDELVTLQAMYDFNPNFSLLASWSPEAGTAARAALDAEGVACRWQNDTSGDTIDVSAAILDETALAAKQAEAASGTSASYGWFRVAGGAGEAIAFDGSTWLVVRSVWFSSPADAQQLVEAALSSL